MEVYKAIAAVAAKMAVEGIAKDRNNQQQGYKFRGIDDVYNALAPIIATNNLVILPRVLSREVVERRSGNDRALFYVTVEVEFDFVSAVDGSKHTVKTYGEAMDSADKATNKAMSAAYKYAAMQAFCIPTEGDNDADASSHDVKSNDANKATRTTSRASKVEPDAALTAVMEQMRAAPTTPELVKIMNGLNKEQKSACNDTFNARMKELKKAS